MKRLLLLGLGVGMLAGCAVHRAPKLTQAQQLLLTTPPTINRAPTPTQ